MPPALPRLHAGTPDPDADEQAEALAPDAPFFLYPANLWPHKNHRLVLEAFARFHQSRPDVYFAFTGYRDGWDVMRRDFGKLPLLHLGYLPPRLLAGLYRRALALVHCSLYEAFGLPLLEAFAAGVPVLCSSGTGLEEVGADAVLACDASAADCMAQGMKRIASDHELRAQLIERGRHRLGCYSWSASAAALRDALA
jgi:glycosyltransferase involved in cell wall biosynthesis